MSGRRSAKNKNTVMPAGKTPHASDTAATMTAAPAEVTKQVSSSETIDWSDLFYLCGTTL